MGALVVIPARFQSTRFPGKPLAILRGKPVIQYVFEAVQRAKCVENIVIATDDERILTAAREFGAKAMLTSPDATSGTDRVAEVAREYDNPVVINVQADEPLVRPDHVDQVADILTQDPTVPMATLMTRIMRREDFTNPSIVKVVVNRDGYAMYFSRAPMPGAVGNPQAGRPAAGMAHKHIGIYGFQRDFVLQFPSLERTALEQAEGLEQLRVLEHGHRIKVVETEYDTVGVDTPADLQRLEQMLAEAS